MRDPDDELGELAASGLRRTLRRLDSPQGRSVSLAGSGTCLNFSSNDYLGLADDAELKSLFQTHIGGLGAGSGASRLVCGTMAAHLELEEKLAALRASDPQTAVVVRPHRDLPVQRFISVMDVIARAGITKVGVMTRPEGT